MIGRNETCPCGSGKPYKKCGGVANNSQNTCIWFLSQHRQGRVDKVQKHIDIVTEQLTHGLHVLKNRGNTALIAQCLILFCYIDTLAQIWGCFENKYKGEGNKFKSFMRTHCFCGSNSFFVQKNNLHKLDADMFWKVRCDIVHFCSLRTTYGDKGYSVVWGNGSDLSKKQESDLKRNKIILFSAEEMFQTVLIGGKNMLEQINACSRENSFVFLIFLRDLNEELNKRSIAMVKKT